MSWTAIVVLAVGLAMDATAAAAARGAAMQRVRWRDVAIVGVLFGGFQAGMPVVGWLAGAKLGPIVETWDHWIAFALLVGLGAKTIWDARGATDNNPDPDEPDREVARERDVGALVDRRSRGIVVLLGLAVATSIDALAVGVTLPMMDAPFVATIAMIGGVTAVLSAIGMLVGEQLGATFGRRMTIAGGIVLIGLGVKILATG